MKFDMICIEDLIFSYPRSDFRLAIDSLQIDQGEKVAVVGPSGSGKTTLLNLICGIEVPDEGKVIVLESEISRLSDTSRRDFRVSNIGLVFQQFELVEYLNVTDNILLPYSINPSLKGVAAARNYADRLAKQMGLDGKLRRKPSQLSQGEQQRVAICRSLIANPKVILADEPTGNLDPKNKSKILELMFAACAEANQSLVVVTHDMNILSGFDRIVDFEDFRQEAEV